LEAISSIARTASKTLQKVASKGLSVQFDRTPGSSQPYGSVPHHRDQLVQREVLVLCARLSDAVLQLALQQLQRHNHSPQHQQQQHGGGSKAVMQLVQSAEHLLRSAAAAGLGDVQQRTMCSTIVMMNGRSAPHQFGPNELRAMRVMCEDSQQWVETLHTGLLRLKALQQAAAQHPYVASKHKQPAREGRGVPLPSAAAGASAAAPAASTGGAASTDAAPNSHAQPWCPIHSSSPAPLVLEVEEWTLEQRLAEVVRSVTPHPRLPLIGCGNGGCPYAGSGSEAALVANRRSVVCGGCGVVRYCSSGCARCAWPAHRKLCGRLAAALGHKAVTTTTTTTTTSSSSSQVDCTRVGPYAAGFRGFLGPRSAAVQRGAAPGSSKSSSSSSTGDATSTTDHGDPDGCRVCAWCGKAGKDLLRCGRCKAAWYCGADHQRAAWKAGHKQECGAMAGNS
jgi:hypothetical protein